MNIGQAAASSGVSAKMIRYYEKIGLIRPVQRGANGYRHYDAADLRALGFIKQSRKLGFSTKDIGRLLILWRTRRPSAEVKALVLGHLAALDTMIGDLQHMRADLSELTGRCHGDSHANCAILEGLADQPRRAEKATASSAARSTARALFQHS